MTRGTLALFLLLLAFVALEQTAGCVLARDAAPEGGFVVPL